MKTVKTIVCVVVVAMLLLPFRVMAADGTYYQLTQSDKDKIKVSEKLIVNDINGALLAESKENQRIKELSYDSVYKFYIDTDIFESDGWKDPMVKSLEAGEYVYLFQLKNGSQTVLATVALGDKITEEDKKILTNEEYLELVQGEGKWGVSSVQIMDTSEETMPDQISKIIKQGNSDIILAGGVPGLHYPVAVTFRDGKADIIYPLEETSSYMLFGDEKMESSLQKGENGYLYDSVAEAIKENHLAEAGNTDQSGGFDTKKEEKELNWTVVFFIMAITAIGLMMCAIFVIVNRKKRLFDR